MQALAKETSAALNLANQAMKRSFDKHHRDLAPFTKGSLVLLDGKGIETALPSRKLSDKRHGPFEVEEQIGDVSYRLKLPPSWKIHNVFHTSKLTPFTAPSFPSQTSLDHPPALAASNDQALQQIIPHKALRHKSFYLCLLTGENPKDARWIPHDELARLPDPDKVLSIYLSSNG
jgi:hypothetical protein